MLNQLIAKFSKPAPFEEAGQDAPITALNDEMLPQPLVLQDPVAAPAPTYDAHHTIEVVDELIGHLMDNGSFIGCLKELDGFECDVLSDGIESAVFESNAFGAYVAEDVCALSLADTDAYDVSHIAMTTLFVHRTDTHPKWEEAENEKGRFFRWLAPFTESQSLLLTCTDELVDPLCDGTPVPGASLFIQVVPNS